MASRRLTQRLIETLKPGKSVREIRDTELRGFGVRILPSGRKRFFVHVQFNGKRTWTKIGDAGAISLADARDLARSHLAASRTGGASRPAEIAAETPFEDVADAVFRRQSRHWKPGTLDVNRRYLKNQILPRFRGQPIGAITSAGVQQWFASLRATPGRRRPGGACPVGDHAGGRNSRLSSGGKQSLRKHSALPAARPRTVPVPGGGPTAGHGAERA